jgi:hypothetical protein
MRNFNLLRARLGCELTQQERKENEPCRFAFWSFNEAARMEVRLQSMREEPLPRACEPIFTRVICAHVPTRCEEYRPESDPCTELYSAATVRERIKPEYGAINLALPRCASKWASIKWRAIEIPGFKRIWLFGRREQTESCGDRARRIAAWWRCAPCGAWQCAR